MRLWRSACLAAVSWARFIRRAPERGIVLEDANVILPPTINARNRKAATCPPLLYGTARGNAVTERSQSRRNRAERALRRARAAIADEHHDCGRHGTRFRRTAAIPERLTPIVQPARYSCSVGPNRCPVTGSDNPHDAVRVTPSAALLYRRAS
jgi:hypothetical protein